MIVHDPVSFFSCQSLNPDECLTDIEITEQIIINSIQELSSTSAAGPDGVPSSLLLKCAAELASALKAMFSHSWFYRHFTDRLSATKISFENSNFEEQLWISIRLRSQDKLLLGGIYRSPSTDITTSTKQLLCSLLKIVTDTNPSHLIIMGDFNYPEIDWNYTISRAAEIHPSHIFLHSIQDSLLYQHVTQPTRHRLGESPNTLDHIITNEEGMINKINPLPPIGNSDHICLNVFTSMYTEEPMAPQPRLNLFKGNYGKISEDMQSIDWDTTLQGQPFTDAYRAFCNILKEKT